MCIKRIFCFVYLILILTSMHLSAKSDENNFTALEKLSLEELLSVKVVSAGKRAEAISDISASIDIITRSEIELYGYQTVYDVLRAVQGIHVIKGLHRNTITMRGFSQNSSVPVLALLVNGGR